MSDVQGGIAARCKCGARLRLPESAAGRELTCPKCRARLRVPAKAKPAPARQPRSGGGQVKVRCQCGAKLGFPASAMGRQAKCPKCGAVVSIAVVETPPDDELDGLSALDALAEAEQSAPAIARPTPLATRDDSLPFQMAPAEPKQRFRPTDELAVTEPRPTCPSCQQLLPPGAKICVQCGINIKSGRPLLITDEEGLDRAYTVAEATIPAISWLIWFGLYPIASEAFGMAKPHVVRGIALTTIAVSMFVLMMGWFGPNGERPYAHMMLWCGSRAAMVDDVLDELESAPESEDDYDYRGASMVDDDITELSREQQAAMIGEGFDKIYEDLFGWKGAFRGYQLLTHALLHADLLHLIGNLLFLMVFGARINALIGNLWTVLLYPLFAISSGMIFRMSVADQGVVPLLGASGAIMGLAGMYIVLFPIHKVHMAIWMRWGLFAGFSLSMSLFAIRGFWVVLFYIAFDVVFTWWRINTGVAHWAHLGGFITGVVVALVLLFTRLVNARGGDILSAILGRHAWALIGRPHRAVQ